MTARIVDKVKSRHGKFAWFVSQTITAPDEDSLKQEIKELLPNYSENAKVQVTEHDCVVATVHCPLCNAEVDCDVNSHTMQECPMCSVGSSGKKLAERQFSPRNAVKCNTAKWDEQLLQAAA